MINQLSNSDECKTHFTTKCLFLAQLPYKNLKDAPTLLLVSQNHDPATPYINAVAMKEYLDAILLTRDADGHTIVFKDVSKDVDNRVVDYLLDPAKYKDIEDKNWVSKD